MNVGLASMKLLFLWIVTCLFGSSIVIAESIYLVSKEKNGLIKYKTYTKVSKYQPQWIKLIAHRPGLSNSPKSVSFELADSPNTYLTSRGSTIKRQRIYPSSPHYVKESCSFIEHEDIFVKNFKTFEPEVRKGYYISRMHDWLIVRPRSSATSTWVKESMSFEEQTVGAKAQTEEYIWGSCSVSCGGGTKVGSVLNCREKFCPTKKEFCNLQPCPVMVTVRYVWSTCTSSCGGGKRYATAQDCPSNRHCPNKRESCNTHPCRGRATTTLATTTTTQTTTTPAPVVYEFGPCSVTCGTGTSIGRAVNCPRGETCPMQSRPCQERVCPITATVGFEKWTPCSRSCGTGSQFMVERCSANSLDQCPRKYRACSTQPCKRATCDRGEIFRYNDASRCCKNQPSNACGTVMSSVQARVIGGYAAGNNAWPWMVLMEVNIRPGYSYVCGATIVDEGWVLTAAHCVESVTAAMIKFVAGTNTINRPAATAQTAIADKIYIHSGYSFPTDDIALIKVKYAFNITSAVRPVCLPHGEQVDEDATCYVAGWGIASQEGVITETGSDFLNEGEVKILPMRYCYEGYKPTGYHNFLDENMLCSGTMDGTVDTCLGDSGGPMMCQRCSSCNWYIAGVTSFGSAKCGTGNIPGIYTNVVKYQPWINQHIKTPGLENNFSCNK